MARRGTKIIKIYSSTGIPNKFPIILLWEKDQIPNLTDIWSQMTPKINKMKREINRFLIFILSLKKNNRIVEGIIAKTNIKIKYSYIKNNRKNFFKYFV